MDGFVDIPERISFPAEEEKVGVEWRRIDAFRKSNELSKGRKVFSFYDGPPFATGMPHYGHILAVRGEICVICICKSHYRGANRSSDLPAAINFLRYRARSKTP